VSDRTIHFYGSRRHPEDAMTEIGVLSYLRQQVDLPVFLLRSIGVFLGNDDFVTLVTEHVDSALFDQVAAGLISLTENRVMHYMWQLLQATGYLHQHHVGHRDISLESILISFSDTIDGQIRLMDFGQAVSTHTPDGTLALRYFAACGKDYYRPPECYIPAGPASEVYVAALAGATCGQVVMRPLVSPEMQYTGHIVEVLLKADVVPGRPSRAVVWGYTAMPADIFSCGVVLFMLAFMAPPWKKALPSDACFNLITGALEASSHDVACAIRKMVQSWHKNPLSPSAMTLLASMICYDPSKRPTVQECLADPWFTAMAGMDVPTHRP